MATSRHGEDMRIKLPRNLKRLDESDLFTIKDEYGDNIAVATKQEAASIVHSFVKQQMKDMGEEFWNDEKLNFSLKAKENKDALEKMINDKIARMEKEIGAFIEHKFDLVVEKMCEDLLSRKVKEEINRRVEEALEQIKLKKSGKGFA